MAEAAPDNQIKSYTTAELRYSTQGGSYVALADHKSAVAASEHHVALLGKALGECIEATAALNARDNR